MVVMGFDWRWLMVTMCDDCPKTGLLCGSHNPKVGGSNPPPATKANPYNIELSDRS